MSSFDTHRNLYYAKTSAAIAREKLLYEPDIEVVSVEAGSTTGSIIEIKDTPGSLELFKDAYQSLPIVEIDSYEFALRISKAKTEAKFNSLMSQWKHDTFLISSITDMAAHPSYQQIIGMGSEALPYIFMDLAAEGSKWYWALKAITGVDPVSPDDRGNIEKMNKAWLTWGRSQGYVRD